MMTITVFLVDDHAVVRDGLRVLLGSQPDIEVIGDAADGRSAIQQIEQLRPHIVVMDIAMPEMNGIETLKAIKKNHPDIQVIMVSSLTSEGADITLKAMQLGATDFILKAGGDATAAKNIDNIKVILLSKIKRA